MRSRAVVPRSKFSGGTAPPRGRVVIREEGLKIRHLHPQGPFTSDVSREGEGGGYPNPSKGGCVILAGFKMRTRGEAVKNSEKIS